MMVTTTIPDKLSVTSFVYQMYQYFTRARQSAISRAKQEEEEQEQRKAAGKGGEGVEGGQKREGGLIPVSLREGATGSQRLRLFIVE